MVRFGACCVLLTLLLGLAGCGNDYFRDTEKEAQRRDVRRSRENAAARQRSRQQAAIAEAKIRPRLRFKEVQGAGCHRRVVRPQRPVGGVLAVACGNFEKGAWPLTVESGFIRCERASIGGREIRGVVFSSSGVDYAADIPARFTGYQSIASIFKRGRGDRYHSVLADAGHELCHSVSANIDSDPHGGRIHVDRLGSSVRKREAELRRDSRAYDGGPG